jgi:hypothetical protein
VFEAGKEVDPVIASLFPLRETRDRSAHRERHVHERTRADGRPLESLGRHTDDCKRLAVDDDGLTDGVCVLAELVLPERVGDDGDEVRADDAVVIGREQAARGGLKSEDREIRAGNERPLTGHRLVANAERDAGAPMSRDPRERRLRFLEIAEHRVTPDDVAVPGLVAGV